MAHDHHLRMVSHHLLDNELTVDLITVPTLLPLFIEHHIACDVDALGRQIIHAVGH
jgi:hypothetical protein